PKAAALKQMKSFLTELTAGKSSYLNYEGIGTGYSAYIKKQGEIAVKDVLSGTVGGKKLTTSLQETVSDTSNFFSNGNMKGLLSYMECANNPACVTLQSGVKAAEEFAKKQDIAKSEAVDGLLPTKSSTGRITTPAIMAQNALVDLDKQGTAMIVNAPIGKNADKVSSLGQIAAGAALSIVSRAANYGIVDKAATVEKEVTQKIGNTYYSFSTAYSSLTK
ncbi:MAG TPA: hypothetical protein PLB52_04155, partial [Candidatus Moranbacteria bacterium]|nr:hypothetical protein [Candidatus Moranbacteria bacterium]